MENLPFSKEIHQLLDIIKEVYKQIQLDQVIEQATHIINIVINFFQRVNNFIQDISSLF